MSFPTDEALIEHIRLNPGQSLRTLTTHFDLCWLKGSGEHERDMRKLRNALQRLRLKGDIHSKGPKSQRWYHKDFSGKKV